MKIFVFLLTLVFSAPAFANYKEINDLSELSIQTPILKDRKEGKIRLENGLEVYLISDPGALQSGAALAVQVGSFDDPKDRPGMAHFVEHMLFLGTKKFPEEGGFTRFLDTHGGLRNAFTASDKTVFGFSVNHNGFDEALDRFAQFFIAPLFNASGVARESKAIDEEFCKNFPVPFWRAHHVAKELANPTHPFHHFSIGNKNTLHLIQREELIAWYQNHYSANLMHLVILSPTPLPELKKQVSLLFSSVPNLEKSANLFDKPLYSDKTKNHVVLIAPLRETQTLELSFELPPRILTHTETSPETLLTYVLGHEGRFSLLAQLKEEGLAVNLGAGVHRLGRNQGFFNLSIGLTTKGVKEYQTVIERCFQTIAGIRQFGLPKYLFDEIQTASHMKYAYQSRKNVFKTLMHYAPQLSEEKLETFPRISLAPTVFDEAKNKELLALLTPTRARYTLMANPKLLGATPDKVEKWMGVAYTLLPLPDKTVHAWERATSHSQIALPAPNQFLPSNLELVNAKSSTQKLLPTPTSLAEKAHGSLIYCSDDRFFVPEVASRFYLHTPLINENDPTSKTLADLYCYAVNETLNQIAYEARLGGLHYQLTPSQNGIEMEVSGFSQKAAPFIEKIFQTLNAPHLTKEAFEEYKDRMGRSYFNQAHENVLRQSGELMWTVLFQDFSSLQAKYQKLQSVDYEKFKEFCQNVFTTRHIEATLYGNLTKQEALAVWKSVKTALPGAPYPQSEHQKICRAQFPNTLSPSGVTKTSPLEGNSLILLSDCGEFTFKNKAVHEILAKGLEEPFFSQLRTQKQMGYIVFNEAREIEGQLYLLFAAQSSAYPTTALHQEMTHFLQEAKENLVTSLIPQKRFLDLKEALIWKIKHPAQDPHEMTTVLHHLAYGRDADFDFHTKWIQAVQNLSYEEFVSVANTFLDRPKLSFAVAGESSEPNARKEKSVAKIRDQLIYKSKANQH